MTGENDRGDDDRIGGQTGAASVKRKPARPRPQLRTLVTHMAGGSSVSTNDPNLLAGVWTRYLTDRHGHPPAGRVAPFACGYALVRAVDLPWSAAEPFTPPRLLNGASPRRPTCFESFSVPAVFRAAIDAAAAALGHRVEVRVGGAGLAPPAARVRERRGGLRPPAVGRRRRHRPWAHRLPRPGRGVSPADGRVGGRRRGRRAGGRPGRRGGGGSGRPVHRRRAPAHAAATGRPARGRARRHVPERRPPRLCVVAPAELDGWRTSNAGRWLVLATDADVAAAHATRLFFPANRRLFGFVRDDRTEDLWQLTSRLRCFW